mgnify:FL=1|jgi:hypothetical protein
MNPAALLHEHLTVWRGTTSTTLHSHFHATTSGDNVTEDEMVARILDAARLLIRINRVIEGLDRSGGHRTGPYRRNYPVWCRSVLSIDKTWHTGATYSPEDICPIAALDALDSLASVLDLVTPAPGRLSHQHLTALVTEIASLLDDDATLSEELRAHLHMVVAHMRDCLANPDRYDLADLAEAAEDLLGAAKNAAEETTDPRTRSRWEKFRDGIVYPTVAGLIVNGATAGMPLLITAGQHLLNQG